MRIILKLLTPLYLTTAAVYATASVDEEDALINGGIGNYQPPSGTNSTPDSNTKPTGGTDTNPPVISPTLPVAPPQPTPVDILTDAEQLAAALAKSRLEEKDKKSKAQKNAACSRVAKKLTTRVEDLLMSNCDYGPITLQVNPKDLLKLLNALDQYAYCTSKHKLTDATSKAGITYGLGIDNSADEMLLLNATLNDKSSLDGQIVGPFNWPRINGWTPLLTKATDAGQKARHYSTGLGIIDLIERTSFANYYNEANPIPSKAPYKSWQDILSDSAISTGALSALIEMDEDNTSHQRLNYFYTLSKEQQENILKITLKTRGTLMHDPGGGEQSNTYNNREFQTDVLGLSDYSEIRKRIEAAGYNPSVEKSPVIDTRIYTGIGDIVEIVGLEAFRNIQLLDKDNKDQRRLTFFFALDGARQSTLLMALIGASNVTAMRQRIEDAGGPPAYRKFQSFHEIQEDSEINPKTIAALKILDGDNIDSRRQIFFLTLSGAKQAEILQITSLESLRRSIEDAGGPPAYCKFQGLLDIQDDLEINPKTVAALKELDDTHSTKFFNLTACQQYSVLQGNTSKYGIQLAMDMLCSASLAQLKAKVSPAIFDLFLQLDDDNDTKARLNYFLSLPPKAISYQDTILSKFPDIQAVKYCIEQLSIEEVPVHFPLKEITSGILESIKEDITNSDTVLTLFATLDDKYSDINKARKEAFFKASYKNQIAILKATDPLNLYSLIYIMPPHGPMEDDEAPWGQIPTIDRVSPDKAPLIQGLSEAQQSFFFKKLPVVLQSYILGLADSPSNSAETKIATIKETIKKFGGPAAL